MGPFLSLLDVVNVSLSTLAVELHSSLTTIQWATSGYLLAVLDRQDERNIYRGRKAYDFGNG
jgi:hypothetical protein